MKGKLVARFCMPNVSRVRSRIENPSPEFSKVLRDTLTTVVCDVLNKSTLDIRARFIQEVKNMDLKYKSAQHEAKVMSVVESFFDAVFAPTNEALEALVGDADRDETEAPAEEETVEATDKEKKPSKKAKAPAEDFE